MHPTTTLSSTQNVCSGNYGVHTGFDTQNRGFSGLLEVANKYSRECVEIPTQGPVVPPGGNGQDIRQTCQLVRPTPGNGKASCLLQDPTDFETLYLDGRLNYWPTSRSMPGGRYSAMNAMSFWDYEVTDEGQVVWKQSPPQSEGGYADRENWPPLEGRRCADEPETGEVPCDAWYMQFSLNGRRRADGTIECSNCNYCGVRYPNRPRDTCDNNMYHRYYGCRMPSSDANTNMAYIRVLFVTTNIDSFCM